MPNNLSPSLSKQQTSRIVWTLLSLMPIIGMAVDLIAPSLPAISTGLSVSNQEAKYVISIYLLGYALGNFFTGFLTDAIGRQKLIRINLFAFMLVSLIPVYFPTIKFLLLARFLQGLSMGAIAILVRAIFADILLPEKLIRLGVLIGTMWSLGPIIGPVLGGYLQFYFNWQAGFYFFALFSFVGFIAIYRIIPETHFNLHPLNIKTIKKNLKEIIMHSEFMGIVFLMGFLYSLIIVFNTMGSFLIQSRFHYSSLFFGYMALSLGVVFLIATLACRYFLTKYEVNKLFLVSIHVALVMAVILFIVSYFFRDSILLTNLASGVMYFTCGFVFPMSMGKGLSLFRHIAGTAVAVMYLVNTLITSLSSFAVSFINHQEYLWLMGVYLLLLSACAVMYWTLIREVVVKEQYAKS